MNITSWDDEYLRIKHSEHFDTAGYEVAFELRCTDCNDQFIAGRVGQQCPNDNCFGHFTIPEEN